MNGNDTSSLLGPILLPALICFLYSTVYVAGGFDKIWYN